MATSNMMIPDMGGAQSVEVIEICVAVGDVVDEGDSIIVVETDKASMEIPASSAGTIKAILLKEGDTCSMGDVMIEIEAAHGDSADAQVIDVKAEEVAAATAEVEVVSPAPVLAVKESESASSVESERLALVPDLGGATDVEIIEISVKVGDELSDGDSLVVLETDKASMEIPVNFAGTVLELKVAEGQKVNVGDTIAVLMAASNETIKADEPVTQVKAPSVAVTAQVSKAAVAQKVVSPAKAPAPKVSAAAPVRDGSAAHAGPAVRMLARELGVDLGQVSATGPRGRVLKEDVQVFEAENASACFICRSRCGYRAAASDRL